MNCKIDYFQKIALGLIVLLLFGCTENLLDEIADKDTNDARYFQAKMEINDRDYAAAIALLESIDASYLTVRERVPVYASAYAGRCGLEFLTLLDSLQNGGSNTIFSILMAGFPGATIAENLVDCLQSQSILAGIGDQDARDGDENLLMAFVSLSTVGTALSALADTDDDGNADATFDQCDLADLPEQRVREIGASVAIALLSLTAIGTDYGVGDSLSDVSDICALDPSLAAFCTNTDPASFTADEVRFLRYAIGSSDYGIDSCNGGGLNFNDCAIFYEPPGAPDCF